MKKNYRYCIVWNGLYPNIELETNSLMVAYRTFKEYQISGEPVLLVDGDKVILEA